MSILNWFLQPHIEDISLYLNYDSSRPFLFLNVPFRHVLAFVLFDKASRILLAVQSTLGYRSLFWLIL